jgi:hypothetical protein
VCPRLLGLRETDGGRARAYLTHAQTEKGEEPDPDLREPIFKKNNYGQRVLIKSRLVTAT